MIQTSKPFIHNLLRCRIAHCHCKLFPLHAIDRIAIAGNNKRVNILDLSTLKRDHVEIQALTSKIQGKVLALAWHPTNENLLSFSTNEGRVSELAFIFHSSLDDF